MACDRCVGAAAPRGRRADPAGLREANAGLRERVRVLELGLRKLDEQRRALLHILGDLNEANRRLADQRKAMLHILVDYEKDRSRLAGQTERLHGSRRALLHLLLDVHRSNLRLEGSRKAMIHIMSDLHETTAEVRRRERELRDKQEQLVQAGKLALIGELATGIAHELNNPLNNIGLFVGNVVDRIELGPYDRGHVLYDLGSCLQQVRKATEIISHLRTFGRAAPVSREPLRINDVLRQALALVREQLRLRQIRVTLRPCPGDPVVTGNAIQLEQVFVNLLTNARDAVAQSPRKEIEIAGACEPAAVSLSFRDTGPGVPKGLERRIFDPFFTTKDVGAGTGLGLSIAYGIVEDHGGVISLSRGVEPGTTFVVRLPRAGCPA